MATEVNERRLTVKAGDAGTLVKGLFGLASIRGGELSLNAIMPSAVAASHRDPGGVPEYSGVVTVKNCTVLNQALFTRLFSSI